MGLSDEVRHERNQRAAAAQAAAELRINEDERRWASTQQALDSAAPEVIRACRELGYPTTGWLVRGWVFLLGSYGLQVLFRTNGSWQFVTRRATCRRRLDRKGNQCVIWCNSNHASVQKWRESGKTLTPESILDEVKLALVAESQHFHLHRPRAF